MQEVLRLGEKPKSDWRLEVTPVEAKIPSSRYTVWHLGVQVFRMEHSFAKNELQAMNGALHLHGSQILPPITQFLLQERPSLAWRFKYHPQFSQLELWFHDSRLFYLNDLTNWSLHIDSIQADCGSTRLRVTRNGIVTFGDQRINLSHPKLKPVLQGFFWQVSKVLPQLEAWL